jgi:hypothetical protein
VPKISQNVSASSGFRNMFPSSSIRYFGSSMVKS